MRHPHMARRPHVEQLTEGYMRNGKRYATFICSCGTHFESRVDPVKRGATVSCGCYNARRTHGLSKTKLHNIWLNMKNRCSNENNKSYKNYGARGISVCTEWADSYEEFYSWAIANGYSQGLAIDRIDNDGNYHPSNCRWVTQNIQNTNTRLIHSTNKSGFRGVSYYKPACKWRASIQVNYKSIWLGLFDTPKEAAISRDIFVINNGLLHPLNFKHGVCYGKA